MVNGTMLLSLILSKSRSRSGAFINYRNQRHISGEVLCNTLKPFPERFGTVKQTLSPACALAQSHGLNRSMPKPSKSLTLRVTMVKSCSRAVAAMNPFATLSGLPFNLHCPASKPHRSAIGSFTGRKRPSDHDRKVSSSHCWSPLRRLLSGRTVFPFRISPRETTLNYKYSSSALSSHWQTLC